MWQEFEGSDWLSIHFEGVELPSSLMGISILVSIDHLTERTGDWIWRLSHCRGVEKNGEAQWCRDSAQEIMDYMIENRLQVLEMIAERLGGFGFAADRTFSEWMESLVKILQVTSFADGVCSWTAKDSALDSKVQLERGLGFFDSLD